MNVVVLNKWEIFATRIIFVSLVLLPLMGQAQIDDFIYQYNQPVGDPLLESSEINPGAFDSENKAKRKNALPVHLVLEYNLLDTGFVQIMDYKYRPRDLKVTFYVKQCALDKILLFELLAGGKVVASAKHKISEENLAKSMIVLPFEYQSNESTDQLKVYLR